MSLKTQTCCEKVRSPFSYFVISIFGTHEVTRLPWRLSKTKKTNKTNKIRAICRNWTNDLSLTKRMLYHSADMAHNNWRARSLHKCWECYVLIHSCPNKKTSTEKELPRNSRGEARNPNLPFNIRARYQLRHSGSYTAECATIADLKGVHFWW